MNDRPIRLLLFGVEVDVSALVARHGPDWRRICADPGVAREIDMALLVLDSEIELAVDRLALCSTVDEVLEVPSTLRREWE